MHLAVRPDSPFSTSTDSTYKSGFFVQTTGATSDDIQGAEAALTEAYELSRQTGDAGTLARALGVDASLLGHRGKYIESEQKAREAIAALKAAGVQDALAQTHGFLGWILAEKLERPDDALIEIDSAIEIGKRRDLREFVMDLLAWSIRHYSEIGDDAVVIEGALELARLAEIYQAATQSAFALLSQSDALARQGHLPNAHEAAIRGLEHAHRSEDSNMIAAARLTLATRLRERGDMHQGLEASRQAETAYISVCNWDGVVLCQLFRAQVMNFDLDRPADAAEQLSKAIEIDIARNHGQRAGVLQNIREAIQHKLN